jgi:hypothetical protein
MSYQTCTESSKEDELEVDLINWNSNGKLGFSITGGIGSQHIRGDDGIYVKSIQEGGLVSWDGRIWVGDKLIAVKQGLEGERISLNNCTHETAVSILRKFCSGKRVTLIVKKFEVNLINWNKNDHLGFSISGGIDRQHIPGDSRIYIASIVHGGNASKDGRLSVGDRLVAVKQNFKVNGMRSGDFFLMDRCTHEDAVSALQESRKGKHVVLVISKNRNIHPRLRFDDTPLGSNNSKESKDQQAFSYGQNLLPRNTLLPHASSKMYSDRNVTKSILKHRKSSSPINVDSDEGLGETCAKIKKPIRIKYITGEPITQEIPTTINHSKTKLNPNSWCYNGSTSEFPKNVDNHLEITTNDALDSSGSSTTSSSTIYEYDSALSSISSEDESHFLDFSEVTKVLPEVNKPKPGHFRQNSRHIIEPLILKSFAPVSHFSRPPLNKNRMFSSGEPTDEIMGHEVFHENTKLFHDKLNTKPNEKELIEHSLFNINSTCFNKRYNIPSDYQNTISDVFENDLTKCYSDNLFNHVNTKHFVKTTRHYAL